MKVYSKEEMERVFRRYLSSLFTSKQESFPEEIHKGMEKYITQDQ